MNITRKEYRFLVWSIFLWGIYVSPWEIAVYAQNPNLSIDPSVVQQSVTDDIVSSTTSLEEFAKLSNNDSILLSEYFDEHFVPGDTYGEKKDGTIALWESEEVLFNKTNNTSVDMVGFAKQYQYWYEGQQQNKEQLSSGDPEQVLEFFDSHFDTDSELESTWGVEDWKIFADKKGLGGLGILLFSLYGLWKTRRKEESGNFVESEFQEVFSSSYTDQKTLSQFTRDIQTEITQKKDQEYEQVLGEAGLQEPQKLPLFSDFVGGLQKGPVPFSVNSFISQQQSSGASINYSWYVQTIELLTKTATVLEKGTGAEYRQARSFRSMASNLSTLFAQRYYKQLGYSGAMSSRSIGRWASSKGFSYLRQVQARISTQVENQKKEYDLAQKKYQSDLQVYTQRKNALLAGVKQKYAINFTEKAKEYLNFFRNKTRTIEQIEGEVKVLQTKFEEVKTEKEKQAEFEFNQFYERFLEILTKEEQSAVISGNYIPPYSASFEGSIESKTAFIQSQIADIPRWVQNEERKELKQIQISSQARSKIAQLNVIRRYWGASAGLEKLPWITGKMQTEIAAENIKLGGSIQKKTKQEYDFLAAQRKQGFEKELETFIQEKKVYDWKNSLENSPLSNKFLRALDTVQSGASQGIEFFKNQFLGVQENVVYQEAIEQLEAKKEGPSPWSQEIQDLQATLEAKNNRTWAQEYARRIQNAVAAGVSISSKSLFYQGQDWKKRQSTILFGVNGGSAAKQKLEKWIISTNKNRTQYRPEIESLIRKLVLQKQRDVQSGKAGYNQWADYFYEHPLTDWAKKNQAGEQLRILTEAHEKYQQGIQNQIELLKEKQRNIGQNLWNTLRWGDQTSSQREGSNLTAVITNTQEDSGTVFSAEEILVGVEQELQEKLEESEVLASTANLVELNDPVSADPEKEIQGYLRTLHYYASPEGQKATDAQNEQSANKYKRDLLEKYKNDPRFVTPQLDEFGNPIVGSQNISWYRIIRAEQGLDIGVGANYQNNGVKPIVRDGINFGQLDQSDETRLNSLQSDYKLGGNQLEEAFFNGLDREKHLPRLNTIVAEYGRDSQQYKEAVQIHKIYLDTKGYEYGTPNVDVSTVELASTFIDIQTKPSDSLPIVKSPAITREEIVDIDLTESIASREEELKSVIIKNIEEGRNPFSVQTASTSGIEAALFARELFQYGGKNKQFILDTIAEKYNFSFPGLNFSEIDKEDPQFVEENWEKIVDPENWEKLSFGDDIGETLSGIDPLRAFEPFEPNTWDSYTNKQILNLHPLIQEDSNNFIDKVKDELGLNLRINFEGGFRSPEMQEDIWSRGRNEKGEIIGTIRTNAKAFQSSHNYGIAIDVLAIKDDLSGIKSLTEEEQLRIGEIGKSIGFEWGGDWSFYDPAHFQLKLDYTMEDLYDLFQSSGKPLNRLPLK